MHHTVIKCLGYFSVASVVAGCDEQALDIKTLPNITSEDTTDCWRKKKEGQVFSASFFITMTYKVGPPTRFFMELFHRLVNGQVGPNPYKSS